MKPKLTIGMAVYEDYFGVEATLKAFRVYHDCRDVEFIVVCNRPGTRHAAETLNFVRKIDGKQNRGAKFIDMAEPQGTSAPRDRVFKEASGHAVLCIDSHITPFPGLVEKLIQYWHDHPDSKDILSGPMVYDDGEGLATHYDDFWRGEMWGIWGWAMECPCGKPDALRFTIHDVLPGLGPQAIACQMGFTPVSMCGACGRELPQDKSHANLKAQGYRHLGINDNDPLFEIPGMGLGLFSCQREAWPGFHPLARGFGGEELYIHEKFRNAGGRALCAPWAKWMHRWGKPDGQKFKLDQYDKVRNYVLEFQELGRDLEEVRVHFCTGLGARQPNAIMFPDWDYLLKNPEQHTEAPKKVSNTAEGRPQPNPAMDLPQLKQWFRSVPRDLDKHIDKLAELAKDNRVTEFTLRRESSVAFLSGYPAKLTSYSTERDEHTYGLLKKLGGPMFELHYLPSNEVKEIAETDVLFINTRHTAKQLRDELGKFAPSTKHYIVIHNTVLHGKTGEDGGPGLTPALAEFLDQNEQWFVAWHTTEQYGMTVLSCVEADRPEKPPHPELATFGPGTELKAILAGMGIHPGPTCDCNAKARTMDEWGVEGCRARKGEIVAWITANQKRWNWEAGFTEKFAVRWNMVKSIFTGQAFEIHSIESLVDAAINRAEEKARKKKQHEQQVEFISPGRTDRT